MEFANTKIGVIGHGHVGLPIAVTFAGRYPLTGFDIRTARVVAHRRFAGMGSDGIRRFGKADAVIYDVKYLLPADQTDGRL